MAPRKPLNPAAEADVGRDFYAGVAPDLDVGFFSPMWHLISLGHLVATDLDRIARRHGLSIADLLVLGAMRIAGPERLRATDLALRLHITNAALSPRIARLARAKLLERVPTAADKRAHDLVLTEEGAVKTDAAIAEVSRTGQFARNFVKLSDADRAGIARTLGLLHDMADRDFVP
jgi:DNA-binding MarR family transcriptional regulator